MSDLTVTHTQNAYYYSRYQVTRTIRTRSITGSEPSLLAETAPISRDLRGQLVEKISLDGLTNFDDLDILSLAVDAQYCRRPVRPIPYLFSCAGILLKFPFSRIGSIWTLFNQATSHDSNRFSEISSARTCDSDCPLMSSQPNGIMTPLQAFGGRYDVWRKKYRHRPKIQWKSVVHGGNTK